MVRNIAELAPNTERTLRPEESQGTDEANGNPVHLLRYPHGKRGASGGQDRTESTAGGLLKRKNAHRNVLHRVTMPLPKRMDKNPDETTGMRY